MANYYQNLSRLPSDYCDVCVNKKKNDSGEQDTSLSVTRNIVVGHLRNDDVRILQMLSIKFYEAKVRLF